MKLKNFESAYENIETAKALSIEPEITEIEKLINILNIEHELYKKSLEVFDKDCEGEFYKKINNLFIELRDSVASNSDVFKNTYIDNKKNMENLCNEFKKDEKLKLYFLKKGGLELIFTFIKRFPDLLKILSMFNNEDRFMLQINNIKGYNKLINILFMSDEFSKNFSFLHFKIIIEILENSSQLEEIRKTLTNMKNFKDLFLVSFLKFDISIKENIDNKDRVLILMNFFTFICNMCYSSVEIRTDIAENFSKIFEKINLFMKMFKLDSILNKNLLETILSFLGNMSCDTNFRNSLGKEDKFILFLLEQMKKITALGNFTEEYEKIENYKNKNKKNNNNNNNNNNDFNIITYYENIKEYEHLIEKIICVLYNISFKDDLNLFFIENELHESLIYFINKVYKIFYEEKNKNYFLSKRKSFFTEFDKITLVRVLMMISKLTKILPGYTDKEKFKVFKSFVNNKDFFLNIYEMVTIENMKIESLLIDHLIK
jgi:hypothetical protein